MREALHIVFPILACESLVPTLNVDLFAKTHKHAYTKHTLKPHTNSHTHTHTQTHTHNTNTHITPLLREA